MRGRGRREGETGDGANIIVRPHATKTNVNT